MAVIPYFFSFFFGGAGEQRIRSENCYIAGIGNIPTVVYGYGLKCGDYEGFCNISNWFRRTY